MVRSITARPSMAHRVPRTGEVTLAQRMSDAGRRAMTGMDNRLDNIPADAGAGFGVFDTLQDSPNPACWRISYAMPLRRFYGTAGRAFLASW